jgi:glycosyltransferase involved in cell wall biosynthesis
MHRLLWLAYHFPPLGGGGVQRSVAFVRHLPAHGYAAAVVTGPGAARDRWTPPDESLLAKVPDETAVHRLDGTPPVAGRRRQRLDRWLALDSPFARWWTEGALDVGSGVEGVDAVYASLSPYESGAVAVELARRHGVPCVLDLRDPWALDEMMVFPTALHRRRELRRMRSVLGAADAVVMNTAEARRAVLERFPELDESRVAAIPNGFDPKDFAEPEPERRDGTFRIVHTGSLHTDLGLAQRRRRWLHRALGGSESGVDILTRSHAFLLEAVTRVVRSSQGSDPPIELHLAGVLSRRDRELLQRGPAPVRLHGYLEHAESVRLVRSADLLFLPMHDLPPGRRARIVPGKTYEYVASGRPILAAVPDGDARELLASLENVSVCRPGDVDAMAAAIARARRALATEGRAPSRPREAAASFDRGVLAGRLAEVLDRVLANGRSSGRGAEPRRQDVAA